MRSAPGDHVPDDHRHQEQIHAQLDHAEPRHRGRRIHEREGPAADPGLDEGDGGEDHIPLMTLGPAPIEDGEGDEDREQNDQVEGYDQELERRHRDVDEPARACRGDQRSHRSEDDHDDSECGTDPAESAMHIHASSRHERRLRQQQQEPGGEGDAVDVEDGLGGAVCLGILGIPRPEEERPREAEDDGGRDRDGEAEVESALGDAGVVGIASGGAVRSAVGREAGARSWALPAG